MPDLYLWTAIYGDGTTLDELDETGDTRGFKDIELTRVTGFVLTPNPERAEAAGLKEVAVRLDPARQRLIFARRRRITTSLDTGEEIGRETVHLVGWQETVAGHNRKSLLYLFEDGSLLHSERDDEV